MDFHLEVTLEGTARAEMSASFWMLERFWVLFVCLFVCLECLRSAVVQMGLSGRSSRFKGEDGSHIIVHCLPRQLRVLSRKLYSI